MTLHAKLSASGSSRWLNCPGSVKAEEGLPDKSSDFAREGSAMHHVAEMVLKDGGYASDWIGKIVEEFDILITHELADHIQTYVDFVRSLGGTQQYEVRVDFSNVVEGGFGTSDAIVMVDRTLHIIDLKGGSGVKVYAKDNSQAMLYAIGVENDFGYLFEYDEICITIVQPKLDHIDSWTIDKDTLAKFAAYAKERAELALSDNPPRNPSEKACVFCKGKATCPELKAQTERLLMTEFTKIEDSPPSVEKLSNEQLAEILKNKKLIVSFLEAVEKYAFAKLENGEPFEGFKLVSGRSNRKISDEDFAIRMLRQNGLNDEDIFKPQTLRTITELEKKLGKREFTLVLGDVITKAPGAPTLVGVEDPRPPITIGACAEDFD